MVEDLTRPIIGIENRTAQEVFDIMCDRFRLLEARCAELEKERDRCHARLEIDHHYVMPSDKPCDTVDDLVRVEIPLDDRLNEVDGIEARDATITGLEQQLQALRDRIEREPVVNEPLHLTEYEMQVLLGTTVYGCSMRPDEVFSLPMAWHRLRALGLIDRTDGLAVATFDGLNVRDRILSALASAPLVDHPREANAVASHETANLEGKASAPERVTDEMVEIACDAYNRDYSPNGFGSNMRRALEAALASREAT